MTSMGQRRRESPGKDWLSLVGLNGGKAITVEESQNCEARSLDGSLTDRKTVGVVEETDLKTGG